MYIVKNTKGSLFVMGLPSIAAVQTAQSKLAFLFNNALNTMVPGISDSRDHFMELNRLPHEDSRCQL